MATGSHSATIPIRRHPPASSARAARQRGARSLRAPSHRYEAPRRCIPISTLSILEGHLSRLKGALVAAPSNCAQVRGPTIGIRDAEGEGSERGGFVPPSRTVQYGVGFLPPLESPRTLLEQRPAVPPPTRPLLSPFCSGVDRRVRSPQPSPSRGIASPARSRSRIPAPWGVRVDGVRLASLAVSSRVCARSTSLLQCDLFRSERSASCDVIEASTNASGEFWHMECISDGQRSAPRRPRAPPVYRANIARPLRSSPGPRACPSGGLSGHRSFAFVPALACARWAARASELEGACGGFRRAHGSVDARAVEAGAGELDA